MTTNDYYQDDALVLEGRFNGVSVKAHSAYDFGAGDFTIEVWTRGRGMGSLVARHSVQDRFKDPAEVRFALGLDEESIVFEMADARGRSELAAKVPVRDGHWHHIAAVRERGRISLLLDGRLLPARPRTPQARFDAAIKTGLPLLIGHARHFSRSLEQNKEITQVRIWNRARSAADVETMMFHQLGGSEPGLVGLWNFDDAANRYGDSSRLANHGTPQGSVAIRATDMSLYPFGKPYMAVQSRLMQDYDAAAKEVTTYRIVLAPRAYDGKPLQTPVDLYAERDLDVFVNDKPVRLSTSTPHTAVPNALGQISLAVQADDTMLAPRLRARPHFMDAAERIVIAPDRHLHATMAQVTPKQLLGQYDAESPVPELTAKPQPALVRAEEAAGVQRLMQNLMAGASESRSMAATPHDELLALANGEAIPDEPPARKEWARLPLSFRRGDDLSRVDWEGQTAHDVRVVSPQFMHAAHFDIDLTRGTFSELTGGEALTLSKTFSSIDYADPVARMLAEAPRAEDGTVQFDLAGYRQSFLAAQAVVSGTFSLLDLFKNAVRVIVSTVTQVVKEIGRVIQTVVATVVDAAGKAVQLAVDLVTKAVDAVRGLLTRAGAALKDVAKFFRTIFDWEDIKMTQAAIANFTDQMLRRLSLYVDDAKEATTGALRRMRAEASKAIRDHAGRLTGQLAGDSGRPIGSSGGVQGSWVTNRLVNSADQWSPAVGEKLRGIDTSWAGRFANDDEAMRNRGGQLAGTLEDVQNKTIRQLAELIDQFVGTSIELVERVATALFGIARQAIDAFRDALNVRIEIPGLTELFEQTILPGKKLTLLNVFSLAVAIPTAAIYKSCRGGRFDDVDRKAFQFLSTRTAETMDWARPPRPGTALDGPSLEEGVFNVVVGAMGIAASVAMTVYGFMQFVDDTATAMESPIKFLPVRIVGCAFSFITVALTVPMSFDILVKGRWPSAAASLITGWIGFAITAVLWLGYLVATGATLIPNKVFDKVMVMINTVGGTLLGLQAIALFSALGLETAEWYPWLLAQNVALALPPTGQLLLLFPKARVGCPLVTMCGFVVGIAGLGARSIYQVATRQDDYHYRVRH